MEVREAKQVKEKLEEQLFDLLLQFETDSQFEVAAVLIQRSDVSQMGAGEKRSVLTGLEIIVGVDLPAIPKEAM